MHERQAHESARPITLEMGVIARSVDLVESLDPEAVGRIGLRRVARPQEALDRMLVARELVLRVGLRHETVEHLLALEIAIGPGLVLAPRDDESKHAFGLRCRQLHRDQHAAHAGNAQDFEIAVFDTQSHIPPT